MQSRQNSRRFRRQRHIHPCQTLAYSISSLAAAETRKAEYARDPSIRHPDFGPRIDESKRFEATLRSRPLPIRGGEPRKPRVEPLYSGAGLLVLAGFSAFAGELAGDRA